MRPQAAAIKALLDEPGLHIMPGCGDGMSARLIEEAGFRIGFVSGSSIAAMRLAMPDMDLLTFPEMADAVETERYDNISVFQHRGGTPPINCRKISLIGENRMNAIALAIRVWRSARPSPVSMVSLAYSKDGRGRGDRHRAGGDRRGHSRGVSAARAPASRSWSRR